MAGGGSSELRELWEMVDEVIAELKVRIEVLEGLVPAKASRGVSGPKKKSTGKKGK